MQSCPGQSRSLCQSNWLRSIRLLRRCRVRPANPTRQPRPIAGKSTTAAQLDTTRVDSSGGEAASFGLVLGAGSDLEAEREGVEGAGERTPWVQGCWGGEVELMALQQGGQQGAGHQQGEVAAGALSRPGAERDQRPGVLCSAVQPQLGGELVGVG